ncbi:coagulation factor 5/8 type domain-containing protein [Streptomyces sp. SCSIO ZS0520]|uniref:coagulation factor 5/8 type domain-containing protein n=1 Tax=Streptomyces sp. SCSIO ZS0520 TaxID=2892996 RepID=UPI0021D7D7C8|nr:coagulation factor 5/8 type domain-containing protein [Streptomyces sp. SCSIO ZS0520]
MSDSARRTPPVSRRALLAGAAATGAAAALGAATTGSASAAPRAGRAAAPDLGPNALVFDPSMSAESIQAKLDEVFAQQERDQFGSSRYALLFLPGSYQVDANIGFNTQILGLGLSPDDVTINGTVHAEADWFDGNATQNFWRVAENLSVTPPSGGDRWAVSQAAPYRRVHLRGDLALDDNGWASGGFLADSRIEGQVNSGTQQQWFTRNSGLGSWAGANWNMVFLGTGGAPGDSFPEPPYTTVERTPVIREKPFLYVDEGGAYRVFVPALRTDATGTSWENGTPRGESLPVEDFLIAQPGTPVAEINSALADGRHLLLTPGIHELDGTIEVTRADTVVLGLGLATLTPAGGAAALTVADVDGVKIAGILVDANEQSSPVLLVVGPEGADADHAANPTSLHDVFCRVGGRHAGRADVSLAINSNHVICDHLWLWRGDHGEGIGWDTNPAKYGLIVNGDDVTCYGLFVEHYQDYQVYWNGERGRTYFFQSEMPYDPPNQDAWMNRGTRGFASYKVDDAVDDHQAFGLGVYCFFNVDPSVVSERAIEAPQKEGVRFRHMVTISLGGGTGTINHVVNDTGGAVTSGKTEENLVSYP